MKRVDIISKVVGRDTTNKRVPTGNTIIVQGGGSVIDIDEIKKQLEKFFLSDDNNDEANGVINFLQGIKIKSQAITDVITVLSESDPNDTSIFTAERVVKELEKHLRKDRDDSTPYSLGVGKNLSVGEKIKAGKGVQLGDTFVPGILTGKGGFFDGEGNGEVESLSVRRFLQVPELKYNRAEVSLGDEWRGPGVGILEKVEPDYDTDGNIMQTGTGWLKLEEGELGAIAVGDICLGIFHSENASENASEDMDDSRGNFQFAGFYTCYFTITEITGSDNKEFRYQMRPVSDRWKQAIHPSEAMTFVCYGSFTREDRQTSVYNTRTYTRLLRNQNTWEIGASNIAMQFGDLTNLIIHGLDMTGYSIYLNNIYMTGMLKQIKPDGTPVNTANDRGNYVSGDVYAYYDRVSYNGSLWLCVNESGTTTEPSKSNSDWLLQVASGDSLSAEGRFNSSNTPYQPNSVVEFTDKVWINTAVTSDAPYGCFTDNNGNRLLFSDGGFVLCDEVKSKDWTVLIDISGFTDGKDGEGLLVQYSSDKVNWHDTFKDSDLYMRQKVGQDGVWTEAMRIVGEDGQAKDGIYTSFQFAVNSSLSVSPTTGWQDAPPAVSEGQFLWMRVRVVNPNENTASSWSVTRIGGPKGDNGKDGENGKSITLNGKWGTGVTIPYLGIVRMGTSSWSAKKETVNPPMWCFTDNSGNRLLFNDSGYVITGEVNSEEYQEVASDGATGATGQKGDKGDKGESIQGIQGCIVRDSEWSVGVEYRNDEALASGTRYIDVALVRDDATATGWNAYKCKVTHVSSSSITPSNSQYWEEFSSNTTSIFTSLIIAKNAKIKFLQGNELTIQKSNGVITAGVSGNENGGKIRFWAGSEVPDNAPFKVDENGNTWMTKARVEGEVNAGILKYKSVSAKGGLVSMEGATFAEGDGEYIMPVPDASMQVFAMCRWFSRAAHYFRFRTNGIGKFLTVGTDGEVYSDIVDLLDNKLYKFTCLPNDDWGVVWAISAEDLITL